ncbi:hypothetical protein FZX02_03380 [Synechococcus sp. MU1644]|nr:hypothetical protein [Synechococcus sp. MU1644]
MTLYLWIKAAHIIFVIALMAGLLIMICVSLLSYPLLLDANCRLCREKKFSVKIHGRCDWLSGM